MRKPSSFTAFLAAIGAAFVLVSTLPIVQPVSAVAAVVASVATGSTSGDGFVSAAIDSTGAVRISAWVFTNGTPATVTDSKGNTLVGRTQYAASNTRAQLFEDTTPVVGSGHTLTVTGTTARACGVLIAWSGTNAADQESASAMDSGANPVTPGSITPSTDNQIVFTGNGAGDDANTFVTPSGYVDLGKIDAVSDQHYGCAAAYQVQTTATATNPSWSRTSASSYTVAYILSISALAATGPPSGSQGLKGVGR